MFHEEPENECFISVNSGAGEMCIRDRKEQRVNDVTVGGERQTVAFRYQLRQIKTGLIFLLCQPRAGKGFHKQAVEMCIRDKSASRALAKLDLSLLVAKNE